MQGQSIQCVHNQDKPQAIALTRQQNPYNSVNAHMFVTNDTEGGVIALQPPLTNGCQGQPCCCAAAAGAIMQEGLPIDSCSNNKASL